MEQSKPRKPGKINHPDPATSIACGLAVILWFAYFAVVNPVMPCETNLTDEVGDRRAPKEMVWLYIVRLDSGLQN